MDVPGCIAVCALPDSVFSSLVQWDFDDHPHHLDLSDIRSVSFETTAEAEGPLLDKWSV